MSTDGGLRALYRKHLPGWQWTSSESGLTSPGVPDSEFCTPSGVTGWIENKTTTGWAVKLRELQVGWIDRRARLGGRVFVAVRRISPGGPRSSPADELWIIPGHAVKDLCDGRLNKMRANQVTTIQYAGPEAWNWDTVKGCLEKSL